MSLRYTTPTPNIIFDTFLPLLSKSELKVLLVITRQTNGWVDRRTGLRKQLDWIAHSQFRQKTGLSHKSVSVALQGLIERGLIIATAFDGTSISNPGERQGKKRIYYGLVQLLRSTCVKTTSNKRNCTKLNTKAAHE